MALSYRSDSAPVKLAEAKAAVKRLSPAGRAHLLQWLLSYYDDDGETLTQQAGRRRRLTLGDVDFWFVRIAEE